MSSFISKFALSTGVGMLFSSQGDGFPKLLGDSFPRLNTEFNPDAAAAAYLAATTWDIIDFLRGDTRYITTKDENGNAITKQYKVHECDLVKVFTNTFVITCALFSHMINGSNHVYHPEVVFGSIGIASYIELAADLFNFNWSSQTLREINGDKVIVINDFEPDYVYI